MSPQAARCAPPQTPPVRPPKRTAPRSPPHHLNAHHQHHRTATFHRQYQCLPAANLLTADCHLPSLQAAAAATFLRRLVEGEDGFLPIRAGMAIDETQKQAALSVLDALAAESVTESARRDVGGRELLYDAFRYQGAMAQGPRRTSKRTEAPVS